MSKQTKIKSFFTSYNQARRYIHVAFWLFLVMSLLFWLGWIDVPGHDDEWMLAVLSVCSATALLVPSLMLLLSKSLKNHIREAWLSMLEWLILISMTASWIGAFGLYRAGFEYDSGVHILTSTLGVFIIAIFFIGVRPEISHNPLLLVSVTALLVLIGGVGNELIEWGSDELFSTVMYGEAGQPNDTLRDGAANMVGVLIGVTAMLKWRKRLVKKVLK